MAHLPQRLLQDSNERMCIKLLTPCLRQLSVYCIHDDDEEGRVTRRRMVGSCGISQSTHTINDQEATSITDMEQFITTSYVDLVKKKKKAEPKW
jgi:hypothetical protein